MKLPPDLTARVLAACGEPAKPTRRAREPAALVEPAWAVELVVPCVTRNESNRDGRRWQDRSRRAKAAKEAVGVVAWSAFTTLPLRFRLPVVVTLTRLGGRRLDRGNDAAALKAVQDGVAHHLLGLDDGHPQIEWLYEQEVGGGYGVRVRVESAR